MTALDRLKQAALEIAGREIHPENSHWGPKLRAFQKALSPDVALQLLAVVEAAGKWRDAHEVVSTASTPRRIAVVKISPCTDEEIDLAAAIDAMRKEVGGEA